jgi:signal transduction histidine kinase
MLANIAHQWRQPLTELSLTLFSLKKAAMNENLQEVESLYGDSKVIIQNMSTTIDDFTNFFKPTKEKHYFTIAESIHESLNILEKIITKEMINVHTDFEDVRVLGISNELTQVMINLIQNSKDAFLQSGVLLKEINIRVKKEKGLALIEFEDNAGGIQEKEIYKIFEPYFTTKHSSSGTGLGLFMSKMICEQGLNGSIDVKSKKGTTTFRITIPLQEAKREDAQ